MKREEVLLYINSSKLYLYRINKEKEVIKKINTSSFFKYGEINNEEAFINALDKYIDEKYVLKPNVTVLYNDICNYDIKFMYKYAFELLGYNKINLISYTDIFKNNINYEKLIIHDKDIFIDLYHKKVFNNIKEISKKQVIIGNIKGNHIHYADEDYIYNVFKKHILNSKFTK